MNKIQRLNIKEITKIANEKEWKYSISFDGGDLDFINETSTHVRVEIDHNTKEVLMYPKKLLHQAIRKFVDFNKIDELHKLREEEDNWETDYIEYYYDFCVPILREVNPNLDTNRLYVNSYDYIFRYIDYLKFTKWQSEQIEQAKYLDTPPF